MLSFEMTLRWLFIKKSEIRFKNQKAVVIKLTMAFLNLREL